jgi:hypothetical protein
MFSFLYQYAAVCEIAKTNHCFGKPTGGMFLPFLREREGLSAYELYPVSRLAGRIL